MEWLTKKRQLEEIWYLRKSHTPRSTHFKFRYSHPISAIFNFLSCCDRISCFVLAYYLCAQGPTYLFNCAVYHVSCDQDGPSLPQSQCACNGLILNTRVPLRFDNKDAVCGGEIQTVQCQRARCTRWGAVQLLLERNHDLPKSTSTRCHDEHWCLPASGKIIEDFLPTGKRTLTIYSFVGYGVPL